MKIAYLGPEGTFTEDALKEATQGFGEFEHLRKDSIHDAIMAVERGEADRALVPIENSTEGTVRATLDTLALDATGVTVVGEHDFSVRIALLAREEIPLDRIELVTSHPQPLAQCARFLRAKLPNAQTRAAPSTAEAARIVGESPRPWAALGASSAAGIYGCVVLRAGVEDQDDNMTRFLWVVPEGETSDELADPPGRGRWKTSLVFSELGEDHPGALVEALLEFSSREVNLIRIESRPLGHGLGRYMFFIDLEGAAGDPPVAEAIVRLRDKAESVRLLGSYRVT